jgi:hypothetical protein
MAFSVVCTSECLEPRFEFTPRSPFDGEFWIDGERIPPNGSVETFANHCVLPLQHSVGGNWRWTSAGFSLHIDSRGARLPSGRRSKHRLIVDVSIGWPHDPWGEPAPGIAAP